MAAGGDVTSFEEKGDAGKTGEDAKNLLGSSQERSVGGWKACTFIVVVELLERFAHQGMASNLVSYLTTVLHQSTATAATAVNNFQGTNALLPIFGGFMADAYWGKYKTSLVGCVFYVLGLLSLTLSVSLPSLRPPSCITTTYARYSSSDCIKATTLQLLFFYSALCMTSVGLGCTRPCFQTFGADQFDGNDSFGRSRKSSFFNWWFFTTSIGSFVASIGLVYIQDYLSWGLGMGIPCLAMIIASLTFVAGTRFYVLNLPGGSPLARMAQVFVASTRKWNAKIPSDKALLFDVPNEEHLRHGRRRLLPTPQFRCLDKAAVCIEGRPDSESSCNSSPAGQVLAEEYQLAVRLLIHEQTTPNSCNKLDNMGSSTSPWKLCTVTQVEEVKLVLRIVPIILATLVYGVAHAQATTLFLKQGSTLYKYLTTKIQIAPASMQLFSFVTCLVSIPLYDRWFVPVAQKFTKNERGITLLQRIGVGMGLTTMCMAVAALVEMKRLKVVKESGLEDDTSVPLPMSILWLVPQYVLIGFANVFTVVGKQEFFYDQIPDNMRTMGMALYSVTSGAGSYASSLLIALVDVISSSLAGQGWFVDNLNKCHLDYFYWLLTALSVANMCLYVGVARNFTYKRTEVETARDQLCTHTDPST